MFDRIGLGLARLVITPSVGLVLSRIKIGLTGWCHLSGCSSYGRPLSGWMFLRTRKFPFQSSGSSAWYPISIGGWEHTKAVRSLLLCRPETWTQAIENVWRLWVFEHCGLYVVGCIKRKNFFSSPEIRGYVLVLWVQSLEWKLNSNRVKWLRQLFSVPTKRLFSYTLTSVGRNVWRIVSGRQSMM